MKNFEWTSALSVADAVGQLRPGTVVKAGGIDLLDRMKEGQIAPARLVNIRALKSLDYVREDVAAGLLRIGPLVTLAQLGAHPALVSKYPALQQAALHAATPQVRNVATLGGNLLQRPRCWYFRHEEFNCRKKGGDECFAQHGENQYHAIFGNSLCAIVHPSAPATALVAMGASLELTGAKGKRAASLEQFFVAPEQDLATENRLGADELITEIRLPLHKRSNVSAYTKLGEKESFDWPIAEVAVVLKLEGNVCRAASIVLGAAAPVPQRAQKAEAALVGKTVDEALAAQAGKLALEGATPLARNGYKLELFEVIVRRTIMAALTKGNAS